RIGHENLWFVHVLVAGIECAVRAAVRRWKIEKLRRSARRSGKGSLPSADTRGKSRVLKPAHPQFSPVRTASARQSPRRIQKSVHIGQPAISITSPPMSI